MSYENFAYYYDSLMDDSFYDDYENLIINTIPFNTVFELGCGTGEIAIRLASRGKEVYATDLSNDMLEVARMKAMERNVDLFLKRVDMRDFELNQEVDLILCLCDSINYILEINDIYKTFINVYNSLKIGGCFIFDIDSIYKTDVILKDYLEEENDEQFYFYWKCNLIESGYIVHDVKIEDKVNNDYVEEHHIQRTYDSNVYLDLLNKVGFKNIKLYSDFDDFNEKCERIIFVCIKED